MPLHALSDQSLAPCDPAWLFDCNGMDLMQHQERQHSTTQQPHACLQASSTSRQQACRAADRPSKQAAGAHHGVQVVKTVDQGGRLGELLAEGIAQVVGGVGGNDQHLPRGEWAWCRV